MAMFDKRETPEPNNDGVQKPSPPRPQTPQTPQTPKSKAKVPTQLVGLSVIGESVKIKGDISGSEDIEVRGSVQGTIELVSNNVKVAATGVVTADIKAKTIEVDGSVAGDLVGGDIVQINASGKMEGNIVAPRIVLEDGSKFRGQIEMETSKSIKSASSITVKPESNQAKPNSSTN